MQFLLPISALMAAILATAVPPPNAPTLAFSLSANATDVLTAHGIWAPDLDAFAHGAPNTAGVDAAAQSELLAQSGLEIKDLVYLTIDTATAASSSVHTMEKDSCDHCTLCLKACIPMLLLYPFCAAGCFSQSYCDGCGSGLPGF